MVENLPFRHEAECSSPSSSPNEQRGSLWNYLGFLATIKCFISAIPESLVITKTRGMKKDSGKG